MAIDKNKLAGDLFRDEGYKPHAYKCSLGYWTIGIGRLIDQSMNGGITIDEAKFLLNNDIETKLAEIRKRWPYFDKLSEVRQRAVANMCFQLGVAGFMKFKRAIAAMEIGHYERAALEFADSTWAKQTPARAKRICAMIKSNKSGD